MTKNARNLGILLSMATWFAGFSVQCIEHYTVGIRHLIQYFERLGMIQIHRSYISMGNIEFIFFLNKYMCVCVVWTPVSITYLYNEVVGFQPNAVHAPDLGSMHPPSTFSSPPTSKMDACDETR